MSTTTSPGGDLDEITTWLSSRLAEHEVRALQPEENHLIWRIDRNRPEAAPVFLKIPATYLQSDELTREDLAAALDREGLDGRIGDADLDSESAWLLTRQTTGRTKDLALVDTDPPSGVDRSVRQPPDAPGPVPR